MKVSKVVCSKGRLESIDRLDPLRQEDPGVVDENVELLVSALKIVSQFSDRVLGRQVGCHRVEISVTTLGSHLDSAASPLSLSRETITTEAFSLANPIAVALPIPEFPPVTRHTFPVMSMLFASKSGFTLGIWSNGRG